MLTIAELPHYIRKVERLMTDAERREIINYLATNPRAGDRIEGTRGIRKLRWGRGGQGKSGGARIIYYVHSDLMPLYLIDIYAKSERVNLTRAECNELGKLVDVLAGLWLDRD